MDEEFMKRFFKTIFRDNYNRFGTHIEYIRKQAGTNRVFEMYTTVAIRWNKEN